MSEYTIKPVAHIRSDFSEKFGIPRQAGIVEALEAAVIFEPEYRNPDALRGIEGFSHLWLIWQFSMAVRSEFSPTVRPPRLGGNERMGVFATRSPFRPNALGLSCVRLIRTEKTEGCGTVLIVGGADLLSGTPIYDIKPYIPYADCKSDAVGGFASDSGYTLSVEFEPAAEAAVPLNKLEALRGVLANDPRPRYQSSGERVYAMSFAGLNVRFTVDGGVLRVISCDKL